jgi:hypothetical protein
MTFVFALAVALFFLFATSSLRWVGLLGLAALFYLFPFVAIPLLLLGGAVFYFLQRS